MTIIDRFRAALGGIVAAFSAPDDRYFDRNSMGVQTASGVSVGANDALRVTAMFGGVRRLSATIASLPLFLYQRTADGKEVARDHPLYSVLHDRPNKRQTSFVFRRLMQAWLELRGNAFAEIIPGPRGPVDQLIPIHPSRVTVFIRPDDSVFYRVRPRTYGETRTLLQGEMFHLQGFSLDGYAGLDVVRTNAESLGSALAAQDYGARYLANDAKPGGVIKMQKTLSPEAYDRFKKDWRDTFTGNGRHETAILEGGTEYEPISSTNKDAQFMELRSFAVTEVARILGIPPHKIGDLSKATFSNIEHQALEYVTDCVIERVVNWEQAISLSLISDPEEYFAEHNLDGMLRGDAKSRWEAYTLAINGGVMSPNEVRVKENMNRRKDPAGDQYLTPMNMTPSGLSGSSTARPWLLAKAGAERCVRRESLIITQAKQKNSGDDFRVWAEAFYISHARFVAEALRLEPEVAMEYADQQLALLLGGNDEWETSATDRLSSLALR